MSFIAQTGSWCLCLSHNNSLSSTRRQDAWLDYWLSQSLPHCSLTQPHPLKYPVACRLLLKPVCSSPGCKSFLVLVVPLLHPPPPLLFSLCLNCSLFRLPPSWWSSENWKQSGVEGRKRRGVQGLSLSAIWVIFFPFIVQLQLLQPVFWWNGALCDHCCTVQEQTFSSAFEMPSLSAILVKWSTLPSVSIHSLPWNKSVWLNAPLKSRSHTSEAYRGSCFLTRLFCLLLLKSLYNADSLTSAVWQGKCLEAHKMISFGCLCSYVSVSSFEGHGS